MKFYKRYETLLRLVEEKGIGFVQTNEWDGSKPHFLQMRKEGLVDYESGTSSRVAKINGYRPYGSDRNAYFYTVKIKGINLLLKLDPNNEDVSDVCRKFMSGIFENKYWIDEYKARK